MREWKEKQIRRTEKSRGTEGKGGFTVREGMIVS